MTIARVVEEKPTAVATFACPDRSAIPSRCQQVRGKPADPSCNCIQMVCRGVTPFDRGIDNDQSSFRLRAPCNLVKQPEVPFADRLVVSFRQKNPMQGLSQLPGTDQLPLRFRRCLRRQRKQGVLLFVINDVEAPSPGDQITVAVQEVRAPSLATAIDRVDEVECGVAAEQADLADGFSYCH